MTSTEVWARRASQWLDELRDLECGTPEGSTGGRIESAKSPRSRCWLCGDYGEDRYPNGSGTVMMWQGARHVTRRGRSYDCEPCAVRWTQLDDGEVFHEKRPSLLNYRGAHP